MPSQSRTMKNKVFISGSLAFDIIFSISHDFRNSIPLQNGKIRSFNASYRADSKKEFPGGTAGNISFWLGKSGVSSTVFSCFGKDFETKGYHAKLKKLGVDVRGYCGEFTPHAYMISDPLHQQLIIWQPNASDDKKEYPLLDYFSEKELKSIEIAIFAPGTPSPLEEQMKIFRKLNPDALVIFDPGQKMPRFSRKKFLECCHRADILMGNDIEYSYFREFGIPLHLIQIETLGSRGVRVLDKESEKKFSGIKAKKVVETTGAGDAFRAGFIAGLVQGKKFDQAIVMGEKLGSKCVEFPSAQR